jgi:hypothetical protein
MVHEQEIVLNVNLNCYALIPNENNIVRNVVVTSFVNTVENEIYVENVIRMEWNVNMESVNTIVEFVIRIVYYVTMEN